MFSNLQCLKYSPNSFDWQYISFDVTPQSLITSSSLLELEIKCKRNFFKTLGCIEKFFGREGDIYKIFKSWEFLLGNSENFQKLGVRTRGGHGSGFSKFKPNRNQNVWNRTEPKPREI